MTGVQAPRLDLDGVSAGHRRLFAAIAGFDDDAVRRPSLLRGWSVAHVLAHLARNADSHVRRTEAAARGEIVDQYVGGLEGRRREIDDGAKRPASELVDDVRRSALAAEAGWQDLPDEAWTARSRDAGGLVRPLFELPSRRRQEIEVHLVDLDIGVTYSAWPDDFVLEWLPRTRERMAGVLVEQADPGLIDPREELAWLYGRLHRDGLPELPSWG